MRSRLWVCSGGATAHELSARCGFAGKWHLGIAVTGILDARAAPSSDPCSLGFLTVHGYTAGSFRQTTGASTTEIASHPGWITERPPRPADPEPDRHRPHRLQRLAVPGRRRAQANASSPAARAFRVRCGA